VLSGLFAALIKSGSRKEKGGKEEGNISFPIALYHFECITKTSQNEIDLMVQKCFRIMSNNPGESLPLLLLAA
jgi:hypothetical protein